MIKILSNLIFKIKFLKEKKQEKQIDSANVDYQKNEYCCEGNCHLVPNCPRKGSVF